MGFAKAVIITDGIKQYLLLWNIYIYIDVYVWKVSVNIVWCIYIISASFWLLSYHTIPVSLHIKLLRLRRPDIDHFTSEVMTSMGIEQQANLNLLTNMGI